MKNGEFASQRWNGVGMAAARQFPEQAAVIGTCGKTLSIDGDNALPAIIVDMTIPP